MTFASVYDILPHFSASLLSRNVLFTACIFASCTDFYCLHSCVSLSFLYLQLDARTIGIENTLTGLILVQQWDEILVDQVSPF